MARADLPLESNFQEHMLIIADMDFLVIMVRRFLKTADRARQIPPRNQAQTQLKRAISVFNSRWGHAIDVRDALEHFDTASMFPGPMVSFPTSESDTPRFVFMWPGGNLDLGKLFEDARSILKAILRVLESAETERAEP